MSSRGYELIGVSLKLGRTPLFTDLNLALEGACIGLLGPNGAGKTSLLRLLATIFRPTRGRIFLHGRDIGREPAYARSRIGYVPQNFRPPGDLTGKQVLRYLGGLRQVSGLNGAVDRCLAQTGLERVAHQATGTYSGGMLRRLALAQALLSEPHLLLMDEPTAGLDPEERDRFRTLVQSLMAAGRQILVSTHLLEDVAILADRVVVMNAGRIIFTGQTAELVEQTAERSLLAAYLRLLRGAASRAGEGEEI